MTNVNPLLETRTIDDPDLGLITARIDSELLRLIFSVNVGGGVMETGFQYNEPSALVAAFVEMTDEQILTYVQLSVDQYYGVEHTLH